MSDGNKRDQKKKDKRRFPLQFIDGIKREQNKFAHHECPTPTREIKNKQEAFSAPIRSWQQEKKKGHRPNASATKVKTAKRAQRVFARECITTAGTHHRDTEKEEPCQVRPSMERVHSLSRGGGRSVGAMRFWLRRVETDPNRSKCSNESDTFHRRLPLIDKRLFYTTSTMRTEPETSQRRSQSIRM